MQRAQVFEDLVDLDIEEQNEFNRSRLYFTRFAIGTHVFVRDDNEVLIHVYFNDNSVAIVDQEKFAQFRGW